MIPFNWTKRGLSPIYIDGVISDLANLFYLVQTFTCLDSLGDPIKIEWNPYLRITLLLGGAISVMLSCIFKLVLPFLTVATTMLHPKWSPV